MFAQRWASLATKLKQKRIRRISEKFAAACLSSLAPNCNNFLKLSCSNVHHLWTLLMNSVCRSVGYVDTYHTAVNAFSMVLHGVIPCSVVNKHQSVERMSNLQVVPLYLCVRLHSVTSQKTNVIIHIHYVGTQQADIVVTL